MVVDQAVGSVPIAETARPAWPRNCGQVVSTGVAGAGTNALTHRPIAKSARTPECSSAAPERRRDRRTGVILIVNPNTPELLDLLRSVTCDHDIDCLCYWHRRSMREPIPPGTLDLMILRTLARGGDRHGFEIAAAIRALSGDVFFVEEGSLSPARQRMLIKGWVAVQWGVTAENRRARYYRLTPAGRKRLNAELARFERVSRAVS